MLLLETLAINELHGISTEQQSGVLQMVGGCVSRDDAAEDERKSAPGRDRSPDTSAAAAAADRRPAVVVTGHTRLDDASSSDGALEGRETDDASSAAESDSSGPGLSGRNVLTTLRVPLAASDVASSEAQWSRVPLSDLSAADGHGSDASGSSSAAPLKSSRSSQSSQSSEVAEFTSSRSDGAGGEGEPAAETSRQRYDKLFRYFQTLDSVADRGSVTASRSSSPELTDSGPTTTSQRSSPTPSDPSGPRLDATGSPLSSVRSAASGDAHSSASSASSASSVSSVCFSDSTASVGSQVAARSMGYAGFVGDAPPPSSARSEGSAGYAGSADFTCLRSSSPTRSKQDRASRAFRGANRPRRPPAGGAGAVPTGVKCEPAPTSVPQTPAVTPAPAPGSAPGPAAARFARAGAGSGPVPAPSRQAATPASDCRLWRVPTGAEQSRRAEASRRAPGSEQPSLAAAWYQEFDELMRPCRGDRPLPPHAGRIRYRQPTPSHETLRKLRERVCVGCARAYPGSNYFDIYCHVNTVFRWYNWKLDA